MAQDRNEYMRAYRARKRDKLNQYQRDYLQRDDNMKKHVESCKKWRKQNMTPETRERIRQYQREYYQRRKAKKNAELTA